MNPGDASHLRGLADTAGRQAGTRMIIQQLPAAQPAERLPSGQSIVIGEVPHEWLFPRMAAVIHHAGAGTTAAGLRAGVPAAGVPMLGDQPFWAARLAALGTGPPPIPYKRLTLPALTAAIRDLTTRPSYREQAHATAARLASEDGTAPVINALAHLSD
jgi:sterol 3beta-glucosyltransferase